LFKVPRRNFANESEVFSDMFRLPAPTRDKHTLDGSSDEQPLRLEGIKKSDFLEGISMDLIDKINIARRFEILTWLVPTLNALVQREKPIDLLEGNRLGMEWVLKVAEVRERNVAIQERTCTHCSYKGSPRCGSCNSTATNRCGSCNNPLPAATNDLGKRGARTSIDFSKEIREVFDVV